MTLKHARGNFRALSPFLKAVDESPRGWRRFTASGFMPLSVERLWYDHNGYPVYSVCHYGRQNGDLMCDPEITVAVCADDGAVFPLSFRNDYTGTHQQVYTDDGMRPGLRRDLDAFLSGWLKNLTAQGFDAAVFDQD